MPVVLLLFLAIVVMASLFSQDNVGIEITFEEVGR